MEGDANEAAVERVYEGIHFDPDLADRIGTLMQEALDERPTASRMLTRQLNTELDRLDEQEENLIGGAGDCQVSANLPAGAAWTLHRMELQPRGLGESLRIPGRGSFRRWFE